MTAGVGAVVADIALHLGLGLALLTGCLLAGHGLLCVAERCWQRLDLGQLRLGVVYGFGLVWLTVASVLALAVAQPWAFLPLLLLPTVAVFPRRQDGGRWPWREMTIAALLAAPALLFPVRSGLQWHGPTELLNGQTFGDTTLYITQMVSAQLSAFPMADLRLAGEVFGYFNSGPAYVGAAAVGLIPTVDPFLFFAVSMPTFGVVGAIVVLCGQNCMSGGSGSRSWPGVGLGRGLLVGIVFGAAVPYADWIVESPPVAFALPIMPAFAPLLARSSGPAPAAVLTLVGLVVSLFSKVFLLPALVGMGLAATAKAVRHAMILAAVLAAVASLVSLSLLVMHADILHVIFRLGFRPLPIITDLIAAPEYFNVRAACYLVAELAVVAALIRRLRPLPAAAVLAAMLFYWVMHSWALIARVALFVILAADLCARPDDRRGWIAALIAGLAGLVGVGLAAHFPWAFGPAGWLVWPLAPRLGHSLALSAGLAFAVVGCRAMLMRTTIRETDDRGRSGPPWTLTATSLGILVAATVLSVVRYEPRAAAPFTPELAGVWEAVAQRTPAEAMVFTDQTGPSLGMLEGYNGFAPLGRRQVFMAGWLNSRLTFDELARDERLRLNRQVLDGVLPPHGAVPDVVVAYAVVGQARSVPETFSLMYRNDEYALYRIQDTGEM